MGLFENIFRRREAKSGAALFRTLTAYAPSFNTWNGALYESELVRACIDARARHISKLRVEVTGSARPALQRALRAGPNSFQTWGQFLYRTSTILDMQNNAFLVPVFNEYMEISGFFPVLPSRCELIDVDGEPWVRYQFSAGQTAAVELSACVLLTKFQYRDDFFGESNKALTNTAALIDIQAQGIQEAVRSSATFRFMARVTNFSKDEDLAAERRRFNRTNLKDEGGLLLFPNTFSDIKQIEGKPYVVDADEMRLIQQSCFNYFGVNENILQNKAYGDDWSAFYEGGIEPFAIQFSEAMSRSIFTDRERANGNGVMATANRLQYMSTADKLRVSSQMADRGIMNRDEIREIWNLPALPDGQGQAYTIRGEYYLLGADGTARRHEDDLTGGDDNAE